jgi:hypothetical protein
MVTGVESKIMSWRFFNYKNVKYSKKVNVYEYYHNDSWESYDFNVMDITTGTPNYFSVTPNSLYKGSVDKDQKLQWGGFRVLSPSYDEFEYDTDLLNKDIGINPRLAEREELKLSKWYPQIQESLLDSRF